LKDLESFFEAANALETKTLKFKGWQGPAAAIKTIKKYRSDPQCGGCDPELNQGLSPLMGCS